jgi:hypothetical protein
MWKCARKLRKVKNEKKNLFLERKRKTLKEN